MNEVRWEMAVEVDASELLEMLAVVQRWMPRRPELPQALRQQLDLLEGVNVSHLAGLAAVAADCAVEASPGLRALAANLRAREAASDE